MSVAFLFPGQGAQAVGMGSSLVAGNADAAKVFAEAETVCPGLTAICLNGPEETLRQTLHAQPALYTISCAALAALQGVCNIKPFAAAGHSVGEYAALYAAGAMSFATGLRLVMRRAELMQTAAEARPGGMAAILGLATAQVEQACSIAGAAGIVAIANYNCPGQVVISGEVAALQVACDKAKELGAGKVVQLQVSGAFHSPLMVGAGDQLHSALREAGFRQPRFPVVVNVEAAYCKNGVDFAPYLTMQVSGAVRWEESMRLLLADGVDTFIELGSAGVLAGMLKRIDRAARVLPVHDLESLTQTAEVLVGQGGTE